MRVWLECVLHMNLMSYRDAQAFYLVLLVYPSFLRRSAISYY